MGGPFGPKMNVLVSSSASNSFLEKVRSKVKGGDVYSLKDDGALQTMGKGKDNVGIVLTPSLAKDYRVAKELADAGLKTVLVNGLFKVSWLNNIQYCLICVLTPVK